VIWPRQRPNKTPKQYRYAIVGVLVTDKPLELEGKMEVVLDGATCGLSDLIEVIRKREPARIISTANDVLTHLGEI